MCSLTTKCVLLLQVARYLDSTFYNMTTVTTHDWRTYEEMRTLAQDKYGVSLIETYLPTGKLVGHTRTSCASLWDAHCKRTHSVVYIETYLPTGKLVGPLARVCGTRTHLLREFARLLREFVGRTRTFCALKHCLFRGG